MSRTLLRSRLLGAIGSVGLAAGAAVGGCGGTSTSHSQAGKNHDSSGAGGAGGSVADPGHGGSMATSGAGGTEAGTGSGGGKPTAGASSRGGSGGLASNCWSSPVGVCCSGAEECMDPSTAWGMTSLAPVGAAGAAGEAGAAGAAGPSTCPDGNDLPSGTCYGYDTGTHRDGLCCYSPWKGTCCGRPFVVAGEPRVATAARRADWCVAAEVLDRELDERTRAVLAREWLADALLEHASVASFARFVLDMLAVGAPAWLVEQAQAAIGDEIRHARVCFELATRYAGEALGPGPLETAEPGRSVGLEAIAAAAVREGCVGETLAALQAEVQLESASDPGARAALARIARDEANHAELSWAFVRWAIQSGGDPVQRAVLEAFTAAEGELGRTELPALPDIDRAAFAAHGRLVPEARRACHLAAFRDVVRPCRDALLRAS